MKEILSKCIHCGVIFDISHSWQRCPICKKISEDKDRIDFVIEIEED